MKVRLTGYFLKCTGQQAGGEGQNVWTVVECGCSLCKSGRYCATNEPRQLDGPDGKPLYTKEELAEISPHRHIALFNLQAVGGKPKASDYP